MKNIKEKNELGITLVAIVIIVIILLILAGISIAQLTGNGLFEKAKLAKEKQENAQIKEDVTLADYENQIGKYVDGSRETITLTEQELQEKIEVAVAQAISVEEIPVTLTDAGKNLLNVNYFSINKCGNVYIGYFSANFKATLNKNTYAKIGYIDPQYVPNTELNIIIVGNIGNSDANIEFAIFSNGEIGIRSHIDLTSGNWFSANITYTK